MCHSELNKLLQGGPGCSSFDGLMMEVGPWRIDGNGGLHTIEGGWEEYTTMVYGMWSDHTYFVPCIERVTFCAVDQPPGTGFSYTASNHYLHDIPIAAQHLLQFLENFYTVFPEYKTMDVRLLTG